MALDFRAMADLRIAILDSDSGFVRVLVKRAGDLGSFPPPRAAPPRSSTIDTNVPGSVGVTPYSCVASRRVSVSKKPYARRARYCWRLTTG